MSDEDRLKWDARYRNVDETPREPAAFLCALSEILPRAGRALDIAGGAGRNALWLARRGLEVTLTDISPVGLALAEEEARARGLSLCTLALDLERDPLPPGPWDLILCFFYLHRPLFAHLPQLLAPGGLLVVVHPTRTNLLRHPSPSARFLLEDGELPALVSGAGGLEPIAYEEGWFDDGRHLARLVARKAESP